MCFLPAGGSGPVSLRRPLLVLGDLLRLGGEGEVQEIKNVTQSYIFICNATLSSIYLARGHFLQKPIARFKTDIYMEY
jgi:hypothetical protein